MEDSGNTPGRGDAAGEEDAGAEVEALIKGASAGRLVLKAGAALAVLGVLGAAGFYGYRYYRAHTARSVPMITLPARNVVIGNDARERQYAYADALQERPAHEVELKAFEMDVSEVTAKAYGVCVAGGACTLPTKGTHCTFGDPDLADHPINCVTFEQAEEYCRWAGKRLPTEVEWEYAAGGAEPKRLFPWGNQLPGPQHANICGTECVMKASHKGGLTHSQICDDDGCRPAFFEHSDRQQTTAPVGFYPIGNTPDGLEDMAGNVWEWTASSPCTYPRHDCDGGQLRVIRGGGWTHRYILTPEITTREKLDATKASEGVGFRCAR